MENIQLERRSAIGREEFWTINGVSYRDEIRSVKLLKGLLDNGKRRTSDEWIRYSIEARNLGRAYVPDFMLLYQTLQAAYRSSDAGEIRERLGPLIRGGLATSTRIKYRPQEKDLVVHGFGLNDRFDIEQDFTGRNGEIGEVGDCGAYAALLGSSDEDEINRVFTWLNGTETGIYRIDSRPEYDDIRTTCLFANSVAVGLLCKGKDVNRHSSLGITVNDFI